MSAPLPKGTLVWSDVSYHVPIELQRVGEEVGRSDIFDVGPPSVFSGHRAAKRRVLTGSSGVAHAGQLLAIMGPTGCGKTTLLVRGCWRTKP